MLKPIPLTLTTAELGVDTWADNTIVDTSTMMMALVTATCPLLPPHLVGPYRPPLRVRWHFITRTTIMARAMKTMTVMTKGATAIIVLPKKKTCRTAETPVVTHVVIRRVSATAAATAVNRCNSTLIITVVADHRRLGSMLDCCLQPLHLPLYLWWTGMYSNKKPDSVVGSVISISGDNRSTEANLHRKYFHHLLTFLSSQSMF